MNGVAATGGGGGDGLAAPIPIPEAARSAACCCIDRLVAANAVLQLKPGPWLGEGGGRPAEGKTTSEGDAAWEEGIVVGVGVVRDACDCD